ncbi:dUTP diphosphatase [endosymbiont GvMRE of Glomus versiforme]|uniref:dUTP diphosphatase n=1 Tax=endosymbiont GvMRE of Glomus versiforme TaxID=2039283 RepID=UPI000ED99A54|nr:dUTP diphosphatase [endosymbiont GvMRE of Glomus versiforme]RHZ35272.1 DUTP diphosphatase [endosymbiont GvMRE of Glomus versiforme]
MLSLETIKKLKLEQEKLDQFIIQKNNITDSQTKASFIRTKIALLVEIGELANELETFKHWKKGKKTIAEKDPNDLQKAKEELIDCLHFYLSWVNAFQIDFSDYQFRKLVPEPDENELLLALFSETEMFSLKTPLHTTKEKIFATAEKSWEEQIKKLNPEDKDYQKNIETFKKIKEGQKKIIEKMSSSFLEAIEIEKNKTIFYRWLLIFEELAGKLGMKSEKDIEEAYLKKNKINWDRQQGNKH